jgi:hypothetical protein
MCVRACTHASGAAHARPHETCITTCKHLCTYEYMYVYECARRFDGSVCVCACVRARVWYAHLYKCASVSTLVHRVVYGCLDAHAHTHIGGSICVCLQPMSSCMRVRICLFACIDGSVWTGLHRYAFICIYIYICIFIYIAISISQLYICYVLLCMHVRIYVDMCGHVAHAKYRYVCVPTQMTRVSMGARGFNRHPFV